MNRYLPITYIYAREILDSRGNPTVEAEVVLDGVYEARASVPSGASTGQYEAVELRDGQERYFGLGVQRVVDHINTKIRKELLGMNVLEQVQIDRKLVELDGTDNKGNLSPICSSMRMIQTISLNCVPMRSCRSLWRLPKLLQRHWDFLYISIWVVFGQTACRFL